MILFNNYLKYKKCQQNVKFHNIMSLMIGIQITYLPEDHIKRTLCCIEIKWLWFWQICSDKCVLWAVSHTSSCGFLLWRKMFSTSSSWVDSFVFSLQLKISHRYACNWVRPEIETCIQVLWNVETISYNSLLFSDEIYRSLGRVCILLFITIND